MTDMTFSHDDIRERLIDFLYGELDAEARAAFTAHVEGCEACRAAVTGAEQARALGRAVARAPLSDEVPSRARTAALAAARAAGHEKATAAASAIPARAAAAPKQGWFELLRRRWTFPTIATVAAMAAFLLVRATIFREAKQPLRETAPGELAGKKMPSAAPATAGGPEAQALEPRGEDVVEQAKAVRSPARVSAKHKSARAPAGSGAGSLKEGDDAFARDPTVGGLGAVGASDGAGAAPKRDGVGGRLERRRTARTEAPQPASAEEREPPAVADKPVPDLPKDDVLSWSSDAPKGRHAEGESEKKLAAPLGQREFAAPPPRSSAAPVRAAAPRSDDSAASEGSASVAPSPTGKRSGAAERLDALAAPAPAAKSAPAREQPAPAKKSKAQNGATIAADDVGPSDDDPTSVLVVRAESLMTAHRWAAAAATYRDLLRRFPKHPAAATWRNRLAIAQAAAAAEDIQDLL